MATAFNRDNLESFFIEPIFVESFDSKCRTNCNLSLHQIQRCAFITKLRDCLYLSHHLNLFGFDKLIPFPALFTNSLQRHSLV